MGKGGGQREMGSCVNIRRMSRTKTYLRVGHTTHEVKLILTGCMTCGGVFVKVLTYDDNRN